MYLYKTSQLTVQSRWSKSDSLARAAWMQVWQQSMMGAADSRTVSRDRAATPSAVVQVELLLWPFVQRFDLPWVAAGPCCWKNHNCGGKFCCCWCSWAAIIKIFDLTIIAKKISGLFQQKSGENSACLLLRLLLLWKLQMWINRAAGDRSNRRNFMWGS